jgi:hypothetical protein
VWSKIDFLDFLESTVLWYFVTKIPFIKKHLESTVLWYLYLYEIILIFLKIKMPFQI